MTSPLKYLIEAATLEVLVAGDSEAIGSFFATDYLVHVTEGDIRGGHELIKSVISLYRTAFSDLSSEITVFSESDDIVSWRRTMRANQLGPFKGFPATGLPIVWQEMVVTRVAHNRIAEEWLVSDLAERLILSRKSKSSSLPAHKKSGGHRVKA